MMLRASSEALGITVDLRAITDREIDSNVPGGRLLMDLVDTTLEGTDDALDGARASVLEELGGEALVDAAGVIGNFEMMNRVAEGTGIPIGKAGLAATADVRKLLDIDRFSKS